MTALHEWQLVGPAGRDDGVTLTATGREFLTVIKPPRFAALLPSIARIGEGPTREAATPFRDWLSVAYRVTGPFGSVSVERGHAKLEGHSEKSKQLVLQLNSLLLPRDHPPVALNPSLY